MMGWDGLVLTDSGGFQVFSLIHSKKWKGQIHENGATFKSPKQGDVYELTPESSIDIQMKIDPDVMGFNKKRSRRICTENYCLGKKM